MQEHHGLLTTEAIQMLISSVTQSGANSITELEAERLLNAIARVQAGVPTGVGSVTPSQHDKTQKPLQ